MIPRKPLASWQKFAQSFGRAEFGFARRYRFGDDCRARWASPALQSPGRDCYRFPTLWPDSARVGPFFSASYSPTAQDILRRVVAFRASTRFFQFASPLDSVESPHRTTKPRGSFICVNPFFFSPFSPCLWLAACRIPLRAAWLALRGVLLSLTLPATTPSPALSSAALQVQQLAASTLACHPATDLIAAVAANSYVMTASRGDPLTGRFVLCVPVDGPARMQRGERHV
ncbi:MAG: hypothetical protein JWS11_2622 [Cypionkella sp.]|nr:hypothetical protein [Cypionkella sp.]